MLYNNGRPVYHMLNAKWRIDDDGMLRVTARVLAEGVFDYTMDESPDDAKTNSAGAVAQYIPRREFTPEALKERFYGALHTAKPARKWRGGYRAQEKRREPGPTRALRP